MVDRQIAGGGWVKLQPGVFEDASTSRSTCQIECAVHYEAIQAVDMIKIAPLRIFSFDIECWNQEGKGFPVAERNPVIQIAVFLKEQGSNDKLSHAIWTLRDCAAIPGAEVFSFEREEDMLIDFRDFMEAVDPDILTGYNIQNFDLPYLLHRAETLHLRNFSKLGRMLDKTRV